MGSRAHEDGVRVRAAPTIRICGWGCKFSTQSRQVSDPYPYQSTPRPQLAIHSPAASQHNAANSASSTGQRRLVGAAFQLHTSLPVRTASIICNTQAFAQNGRLAEAGFAPSKLDASLSSPTARRHQTSFHGPSQLPPNVRAWRCAQEMWLQLVCLSLCVLRRASSDK